MFPEGKQMRRHQTLKNGYEYEVSMNVNKMGNPCNGPMGVGIVQYTNESNLYIPQKYNVEQKGLSQVARIELKSCMNGQLAFYGPDELLSALCNKI